MPTINLPKMVGNVAEHSWWCLELFQTSLPFWIKFNFTKLVINNRGSHDKEIWRITVRLSDRSKVAHNKIIFVQNCPQWGLNAWPPDHHSNALPSELSRNLLGRRFLKWALFVSCTTSHVGLCLFLESIEHDFIKALLIHRDNQIVA